MSERTDLGLRRSRIIRGILDDQGLGGTEQRVEERMGGMEERMVGMEERMVARLVEEPNQFSSVQLDNTVKKFEVCMYNR